MDTEHILDLLDTLTAADLKRVHERASQIHALHDEWQNPAHKPEPPTAEHQTYRQEYTKCNKPACKRCSGSGQGHGPYWYAYWREDGKLRKKYIGKKLAVNS